MTYTSTMQDVMSFCRGDLSAVEFSTLCYIIQRTDRFGKESETISYTEFLQGFTIGGPETYVAPATTNKRSLLRAITGLEEKGYIEVRSTRGSNLYTLILEHISAIACKMKNKLKIGKNRKESDRCDMAPRVGAKGHQGVVRNGTYRSNRIKVSEEVIESAASTADAEKLAREKNQKAKAKKASRPTKSLNSTRAAWDIAVAAAHGGRAINSAVDSVTWNKCKRQSRSQSVEDFRECMEWSIENWSLLKALRMSWVDNMTEVPDFGLWCQLYKHFLKHWIDEDLKEGNRSALRQGKVDQDRLERAEREATEARQQRDAAVQKAEHLQRRMHEKSKQKRSRDWKPEVEIPDELPQWEDL